MANRRTELPITSQFATVADILDMYINFYNGKVTVLVDGQPSKKTITAYNYEQKDGVQSKYVTKVEVTRYGLSVPIIVSGELNRWLVQIDSTELGLDETYHTYEGNDYVYNSDVYMAAEKEKEEQIEIKPSMSPQFYDNHQMNEHFSYYKYEESNKEFPTTISVAANGGEYTMYIVSRTSDGTTDTDIEFVNIPNGAFSDTKVIAQDSDDGLVLIKFNITPTQKPRSFTFQIKNKKTKNNIYVNIDQIGQPQPMNIKFYIDEIMTFQGQYFDGGWLQSTYPTAYHVAKSYYKIYEEGKESTPLAIPEKYDFVSLSRTSQSESHRKTADICNRKDASYAEKMVST